jgi:hypothetical protein
MEKLMRARNRTTLTGLAIMMAACGSGGVGLDLGCLFCFDQQPPATITVNAGQDQTVITEDTVVLSSSDNASQGCYADYTWTQTSGPPVSIRSFSPHRTAEIATPFVDMNTPLTFSFSGTCNNGATDTDAVTIHVQPTSVAALCVNAPLFATSYVWTANGCVTDPTDIAGDSRVATVYRQGEVEPNDSMQSASSLTFPAPVATERLATDVAGSVKSGGDLPWDPDDFFIFTPTMSGVYDIYLCNDPRVCIRGTVTDRWVLTLSDQNFDPIAGTSRGSIVEQVLHLRLEAGVSYYVGVDTFVSPSELNYNLTIISDGS